MALTPATLRADAGGTKCGGGYIGRGKKCHAGAGGAVPSRPGRTGGKGFRSTEGGPSRVEKVENFVINNGKALSRVATIGSFAAMATGHNNLSNTLSKVGTASGVASNAALYAQAKRTNNAQKEFQASFGLGATAGSMLVGAHFRNQRNKASVARFKEYRNKVNAEVSKLPPEIQGKARSSNHTWLRRYGNEIKAELPMSAARRRKAKPVPLKQRVRSLWADGFSTDSTTWAV